MAKTSKIMQNPKESFFVLEAIPEVSENDSEDLVS